MISPAASVFSVHGLVCLLLVAIGSVAVAGPPEVELKDDEAAGTMTVLIDGREAFAYQYAGRYALPHFWPVRSPSGKLLTEQHPDKFPHHRSFWIADKIQVGDSPPVDFYHCWKNYNVEGQAESGYRSFIRHTRFTRRESTGSGAVIEAELQWIIDQSTPVLDERRTWRVAPLGEGEYLIDLSWALTPVSEQVTFVSDWVHYAWPYLRMHPQFSGERGGTIINDREGRGQEATNQQIAKWVDYSNMVDGHAEGLAVFIAPDGKEHRWLTREYGTFGPRRPDDLSGTEFTLKPGESLSGRVGILVHDGDAAAGRVAERYRQYSEGQL